MVSVLDLEGGWGTHRVFAPARRCAPEGLCRTSLRLSILLPGTMLSLPRSRLSQRPHNFRAGHYTANLVTVLPKTRSAAPSQQFDWEGPMRRSPCIWRPCGHPGFETTARYPASPLWPVKSWRVRHTGKVFPHVTNLVSTSPAKCPAKATCRRNEDKRIRN